MAFSATTRVKTTTRVNAPTKGDDSVKGKGDDTDKGKGTDSDKGKGDDNGQRTVANAANADGGQYSAT